MTSSGPDRSIASMSLPQWMKSKISDRYDLEQTPFSPPNTDDGFFLVRYKKAAPEQPEPPKVTTPKFTTPPVKQDFETPREIGMRHGVDSSLARIKSTGTDDGFKGDGASCGYSVVAVAHQMIAERSSDKMMTPPAVSHRVRRNSKSLPASPQSSPKLLRKNPYFTNIIFGSTEAVDNENSSVMRGSVEDLGNWAKANRTFRDGDSNIDASSNKTTVLFHQQSSSSAITRQLFTPSPPLTATSSNSGSLGQIVALKAKPSHLREMNFWSPTSM